MLILLCVSEGDINVDGKFTATDARRQRGRSGEPFKGPYQHRENPYSVNTVWGTSFLLRNSSGVSSVKSAVLRQRI